MYAHAQQVHINDHIVLMGKIQVGGKMRTVDLRTGKEVKCRPNLQTRSAFYPPCASIGIFDSWHQKTYYLAKTITNFFLIN